MSRRHEMKEQVGYDRSFSRGQRRSLLGGIGVRRGNHVGEYTENRITVGLIRLHLLQEKLRLTAPLYDALYAYCQEMVRRGKPDGDFKS